ncbi:Protein of unknown function [Bacillus cereus]|uniref:Uncharacterized protein n=1 Tax=Bacillus wiedmannii TaxID=1890302 RepID=A0AB37YLR1_9BACI|nr:Protein of unknown function [Bacillus cereus]SCB98635.1 Protein of unknown function [Bacillus wiedmannii]SCN31447.1 Protein of unknown function [Bacillus wiedmannii]
MKYTHYIAPLQPVT